MCRNGYLLACSLQPSVPQHAKFNCVLASLIAWVLAHLLTDVHLTRDGTCTGVNIYRLQSYQSFFRAEISGRARFFYSRYAIVNTILFNLLRPIPI